MGYVIHVTGQTPARLVKGFVFVAELTTKATLMRRHAQDISLSLSCLVTVVASAMTNIFVLCS